MSNKIHATAILGKNISIGENVTIGPFTVVEDDVIIGDGTSIGNSSTIKKYTEIGNNCQIFHNCVIGELPQDQKFNGEKTTVKIGDGSILREFSTIHRGTAQRGETIIGKNSILMAYAHVAHDCLVGDNVTLVNMATLGGHVEVEDWVVLSGGAMVHQFVKIGSHAFIGGLFRVTRDVPPFVMAVGEPLKFGGINSVGLRRRGFSSKDRLNIKHAYRIYFQSDLTPSEALQQLKSEFPNDKNIMQIVDFITNSERGII